MELPLWEVNIGSVDNHGELEVDLVLKMESNEALLLAGHAFVEQGINSQGFYTMRANIAHVYKVDTYDNNPWSYCEAMARENAAHGIRQ